jgi:hypothetical protein
MIRNLRYIPLTSINPKLSPIISMLKAVSFFLIFAFCWSYQNIREDNLRKRISYCSRVDPQTRFDTDPVKHTDFTHKEKKNYTAVHFLKV